MVVEFKIIDPNESHGYSVWGHKKSGKSAFGGWLAEKFFNDHKFTVLDFWSARDRENLFWCIKDKNQYPIILIHPEYVEVKVPKVYDEWIKPMCDTVGLEKIVKTAKKERRIACFDNSSYDEDHSYQVFARLISEIPTINGRLRYKIFLNIREASTLIGSRFSYSKSMKETKLQIVKMVRECRHYYVSYLLDWQRFTDVDISAREMTDIYIFRKLNNIPRSWGWFAKKLKKDRSKFPFAYRERFRPWPNKLQPWQSYAIKDGRYMLFENGMPTFRHKRQEAMDTFEYLTGCEFLVDEMVKDDALPKSKHEKKWKERLIKTIKFMSDEGYSQQEIERVTGVKQGNISNYISDPLISP